MYKTSLFHFIIIGYLNLNWQIASTGEILEEADLFEADYINTRYVTPRGKFRALGLFKNGMGVAKYGFNKQLGSSKPFICEVTPSAGEFIGLTDFSYDPSLESSYWGGKINHYCLGDRQSPINILSKNNSTRQIEIEDLIPIGFDPLNGK